MRPAYKNLGATWEQSWRKLHQLIIRMRVYFPFIHKVSVEGAASAFG